MSSEGAMIVVGSNFVGFQQEFLKAQVFKACNRDSVKLLKIENLQAEDKTATIIKSTFLRNIIFKKDLDLFSIFDIIFKPIAVIFNNNCDDRFSNNIKHLRTNYFF